MIYILTAGCYSDYHILAATTDKAKAEELSEKMYCDIEEYEDFKIDIKNRELYRVEMNRKGDTKRCDPRQDICDEGHTISSSGILINRCWAKDEKHAIKITNELRTRLIADNMYPLEIPYLVVIHDNGEIMSVVSGRSSCEKVLRRSHFYTKVGRVVHLSDKDGKEVFLNHCYVEAENEDEAIKKAKEMLK